MIRIANTRFGNVEVPDEANIHFDNGLLGLTDDHDFVLLEEGDDGIIGYLQSVTTPWLALPVMDAALLGPAYPGTDPKLIARAAGLDDSDIGMMLVVGKDANGVHINPRAPLIIDMKSRKAAQMLLDPNIYSGRFYLTRTETAPEATAETAPEITAAPIAQCQPQR